MHNFLLPINLKICLIFSKKATVNNKKIFINGYRARKYIPRYFK